jgi:hypothetical protein
MRQFPPANSYLSLFRRHHPFVANLRHATFATQRHFMQTYDRKSLIYLLLSGFLLMLGGCAGEKSITTYEVEKEQPPRMLVVTVQDGRQVWFFKFNGAAGEIEDNQEDFMGFINSVKFVRGEPTWDTPKGWGDSERGTTGNFKRFASFAVPTETEYLDVSVTTLSAPPTGLDDQYLMINLNRWRKQISLESVDPSGEWKDDFKDISVDGLPGMLTDITGPIHLDMTPRPVERPAPSERNAPFRPAQFEYKAPDHWQDRGSAPMVAQEWRVGEGELGDVVRITLSFAGGGLGANVNRWCGQVGLDAKSPDDLGAADIELDGKPAMLFDLVGESKSIVGIVAQQDGPLALFVKAIGPAALVEKERENFLEFARTLKVNQ